MKKINARNTNVEEVVSSAVDDVKSGYKDFEEETLKSVTKVKDQAVTWVEEGISNIKEGTHQFMDDAKQTIDKTAKSIDKSITQGLTQYNEKAQELADKVPGGFGDNVIRYPWVAISLSLLIGIGLGLLFRPGRRT